MFEYYLIIIIAFLIGIFGVVIGGSLFFAIPFIQIMFPSIPFGAVIGNIKVGSLFRGLGSTAATIKKIQWKRNILISLPLIVGTVLGTTIISKLSQNWILPALIIAILLAELAPKYAQKISKTYFSIASILIGGYAGILGAGVGLYLIALLRTRLTKDSEIATVKIQARFIEVFLTITAVTVHFLNNDLIADIWVPWSIGSVAGGVVGGIALKKIGSLSGNIQKTILRIAFAVALFIATYSSFFFINK